MVGGGKSQAAWFRCWVRPYQSLVEGKVPPNPPGSGPSSAVSWVAFSSPLISMRLGVDWGGASQQFFPPSHSLFSCPRLDPLPSVKNGPGPDPCALNPPAKLCPTPGTLSGREDGTLRGGYFIREILLPSVITVTVTVAVTVTVSVTVTVTFSFGRGGLFFFSVPEPAPQGGYIIWDMVLYFGRVHYLRRGLLVLLPGAAGAALPASGGVQAHRGPTPPRPAETIFSPGGVPNYLWAGRPRVETNIFLFLLRPSV